MFRLGMSVDRCARTQGKRTKAPRWFGIVTSALGAALVASVAMSAQEPAPGAAPAPAAPAAGGPVVLGEGPGRDVCQGPCVLFHTPDRIVGNRKSRPEWDEVIDKMIPRGAQVN